MSTLTDIGPPVFPNSVIVRYQGLEFEFVPDGASRFRAELEVLRPQAVELAALSRGWHDPADVAHFDRVFKLEPLFHANGLALIWSGRKLCGLAGVTYDLPVPADGALVLHVGSLALLPQIQNRGFLPTLFSLLWEAVWREDSMRACVEGGRAFLTAITQSPFIMSFLASVTDLYPMPGRTRPSNEMIAIAEAVVDRFDPDIELDRRAFILRNECQFFYRTIPYSMSSRINEFCDQQLRYGEGDTFVAVGRIRAGAVRSFVDAVERGQQELFTLLRNGLLESGESWPERNGTRR
jgi:hypothetical protein